MQAVLHVIIIFRSEEASMFDEDIHRLSYNIQVEYHKMKDQRGCPVLVGQQANTNA